MIDHWVTRKGKLENSLEYFFYPLSASFISNIDQHTQKRLYLTAKL